jgi:hypothetical protein
LIIPVRSFTFWSKSDGTARAFNSLSRA